MSWLSEGIDAVGNWWGSNPDVDKRSAANAMIHRTYDRLRPMAGDAEGFGDLLEQDVIPNIADVRSALMNNLEDDVEEHTPEESMTGKRFTKMQKFTENSGIKRGWTEQEVADYEAKHGERPDPNLFSPGDKEHEVRVREMELAKALLGPETKYDGWNRVSFHHGKMIPTGNWQPADAGVSNLRRAQNSDYDSVLHLNERGTRINQESMDGVLDNPYKGLGQVMVPAGDRGMQNVGRYYTHRTDKAGPFTSALLGTAELIGDTIADWTGGEGTGKNEEIENYITGKAMARLASPIVDEGTSEERAKEADALKNLESDLMYADYDTVYKDAYGKAPGKHQSIVMDALPAMADLTGLVAGGAGWAKGGMKGATAAILGEAVQEDLPTTVLASAALEAGQNRDTTPEQATQVIAQKKQAHKDFDREKIKKRLDNTRHGTTMSPVIANMK